MENIVLPPFAPNLVESTRSIGYSFESALADIIDNSISAGSHNIDIQFDSLDPPWLCIEDDGCGMDRSELIKAMQYGCKSALDLRSPNDLGRFGLGLKTASLSQCRLLTVITKKEGKTSIAQWDLDYITQMTDWYLLLPESINEIKIPFDTEWLDRHEHGTIVLWQKFDRLSSDSQDAMEIFDEKIEAARNHIALVFHRFIDAEFPPQKIHISFNGDAIIAFDPFMARNPATQQLPEQLLRIDYQNIIVRPYILPFPAKLTASDMQKGYGKDEYRQDQGFYIYRNRRLIVWGTWFGLIKQNELGKLARIRVDIPNSLDHLWEIDIKKSKASLPNILRKNLEAIVRKSITSSETVYKYRGRRKDDNIVHVWDVFENRGSNEYRINRDLPIFKAIEDALPEKEYGKLDALIKMIEESLPYQAIYVDLAENASKRPNGNLSNEEVRDIAYQNIQAIKQTGGDPRQFIENNGIYDFFSNYPDMLGKIKGDIEK